MSEWLHWSENICPRCGCSLIEIPDGTAEKYVCPLCGEKWLVSVSAPDFGRRKE